MREVTVVGLDIAKNGFQVHGIDVTGAVVLRQRLACRRVPTFFGKLAKCLIGIEARPRITGRVSCRRWATTCG